MRLLRQHSWLHSGSDIRQRGAILIIVMWIAFGLVSLALYFGHSMSYELKAADNRVAGVEAEQAIEGAARYISFVLSNNPGVMPDIRTYQSEDVPVGNATFWLIGRSEDINDSTVTTPTFGLVDEAGRINLNTAVQTNLEALPRMTTDLAASILNWRGSGNTTNGGASDQNYATLKPPYTMKGSNFESTAELRLVYGMDMEILYGEDANMNGILDANENDGEVTFPNDNRDGRLDPGILEYVTVFTKDPNTTTNGTARVSVNDKTQLRSILQQRLSDTTMINRLSNLPGQFSSLLGYYVAATQAGLTEADFEKFADDITTTTNSPIRNLVNVNSANQVVLEALGFTTDEAEKIVSYRKTNPDNLKTIAWVATALGITSTASVPPAANRLTTHTYQITADIAALGHHDRGYRRVRFVFDTSSGTPQIIYRQDLTHLGWALGRDIREQTLTTRETR